MDIFWNRPLLRVVIIYTPSVTSLLRGENDLKQSDEFQASLTVFLPEITYKHLIASCIEYTVHMLQSSAL